MFADKCIKILCQVTVPEAQAIVQDQLVTLRNVTGTVTKAVPIVTNWDAEGLPAELLAQGFQPDDEIGTYASALRAGDAFRKRTGEFVYHRAADHLLRFVNAEALQGQILALGDRGNYTLLKPDTAVVVRISDMLSDYADFYDHETEDK